MAGVIGRRNPFPWNLDLFFQNVAGDGTTFDCPFDEPQFDVIQFDFDMTLEDEDVCGCVFVPLFIAGCAGGGMKLDGFFFFRFNAGLRRQLNTPGIPVITPLA